jgi:hypothetical protein
MARSGIWTRRRFGGNDGGRLSFGHSAIGIIFELSHVGGEVRVRQFVAKFEYTHSRSLFDSGSANLKKPG